MDMLKPYRERIDALDDQLITILAERFDVIRAVGRLKAERQIPSVLQDRVDEVLNRAAAAGETHRLDPAFVRSLFTMLIDYAHRLEDEAKAARARAPE